MFEKNETFFLAWKRLLLRCETGNHLKSSGFSSVALVESSSGQHLSVSKKIPNQRRRTMITRWIVVGLLFTAVSSQVNDGFKKCCLTNETYRMGYDDCTPTLDQTNKTFSAEGVKTQCPDGFYPKVKPFAEVEVKSDGLYSKEGDLLATDYCVEELPFKGDNLIARYCSPDPCVGNGCLRKCCPNGFVLSLEFGQCQPSNVTLNPVTEVAVRDGIFPNCPHGSYKFDKNEFTLQTDGKVIFKDNFENENSSEEHCVDNLITYEGTVVLEGLRCFPHPIDVVESDDLALNIYPYALFISSIFLIATFIIYAILPELQTTQGLMIMAYSASMSVMFVGLGTIQISPGMSNELCIGSGILVHFTFLATFTWLNALCFDIWHSLSHLRSSDPAKEKRRFLLYSLYAWGVPLVIVVVGQIIDNIEGLPSWVVRPEFGVYKCFFAVRSSYFAYLYGPVSFLLVLNLFFFLASSVILCRRSGDISARHYHVKEKFFAVLILFFVMGVTWIMEVISFVVEHLPYLWIPTDILNISSGLIVFVIFICRGHVWNLLVRKFPRMKALAKFCPCCCCRCSSPGVLQQHQTCADYPNEETLAKSQQSTV